MSDNGRSRKRLWSQCHEASELANLIDALPRHVRLPILQAAFSFTSSHDLGNSYLVGVFRTQLFDCVLEFSGLKLNVVAGHLPASDLDRHLGVFAEAKDPAQVQLAVCDLLEFIGASVRTGE